MSLSLLHCASLPEATDPAASEQALSDFARSAEERFSFSMRLLPNANESQRARYADEALEVATRAVMGRHGMARTDATRVREHYLANMKTNRGAQR